LDMDPAHDGFDGGLPRHVILGTGIPADPTAAASTVTPLSLDKELLKVPVKYVPEAGDPIELVAQAYHAHRTATGQPGFDSFTPAGTPALYELNGLRPIAGAPYADPCRTDGTAQKTGIPKTYKGVMFQFDMMINKVGWHFPQSRIATFWSDAQPTIDGIRPPEPFTMRANTFDCIEFQHVNLIPNVYEQDDFQIKMPTDIVGQHIHLVKFDVTSSDGSANGWNYEDGTMSPDEIRERINAINAFNPTGLGNPPDSTGRTADTPLVAQSHPFFGSSFNGRDIRGARTTIQRWYSDPLVDNRGVIRPLGNVFTHDHFGPSQHQQAGLYATLLIEPPGSTWRNPETGEIFGIRADGGPTSWRADILTQNPAESYREFFFEFADFHLAYQKGACESFNGGGLPCSNPAGAINAPGRVEVGLPFLFAKPAICPNGTLPPCPTAISANDDGTFTANYRNEPVALRVLDNTNPLSPVQAAGLPGDLSWAFSSNVKRQIAALNTQPNRYVTGKGAGQPLVQDMGPN
ncbi:MAG TPA: copper oxidase, partial [Geobacteraceae bacterium]